MARTKEKKIPKLREADELYPFADSIIEEFHPHLKPEPIIFAWRTGKWQSGGSIIRGEATVISGRAAFLANIGLEEPEEGPDQQFLITINEGAWLGMSGDERKALIDHELCHCRVDEDSGQLLCVPHDLEEFTCIVERHGLWKRPLQEMEQAMRNAQQTLSYGSAEGVSPAIVNSLSDSDAEADAAAAAVEAAAVGAAGAEGGD